MDLLQGYGSSSSSSNSNEEFESKKTFLQIIEKKDVLVTSNVSQKHTKMVSSHLHGGYISKRLRKSANITTPMTVSMKENEQINEKLIERNSLDYNNLEKKTSFVSQPHRTNRKKLEGHSAGVNSVRWGCKGYEHLLASASMDGTVRVWDALRSSECLRVLDHHSLAVKDVKWSNDGNSLVSCSFDKTVQFVDLTTSRVISNFPHKEYISVVCMHPSNDSLFLCGGYSSGIVCWDIRSNSVVSTFNCAEGEVQDLCFLNNNGLQFIASTSVTKKKFLDKCITIWDFESNCLLSNQIYTEAYTCPSIRLHPNGKSFVAQSNGNYIALFSTLPPYKLNKRKRYEGHAVSGFHIQCSFSSDGTLLATGDANGSICFYDTHSSRMVQRIHAHQNTCMGAEYHPSLTNVLASYSWDNSICIFR